MYISLQIRKVVMGEDCTLMDAALSVLTESLSPKDHNFQFLMSKSLLQLLISMIFLFTDREVKHFKSNVHSIILKLSQQSTYPPNSHSLYLTTTLQILVDCIHQSADAHFVVFLQYLVPSDIILQKKNVFLDLLVGCGTIFEGLMQQVLRLDSFNYLILSFLL